MPDKPKTPAQIRKEIEANKKANEKLQKELNNIAQGAINKEIEAVEQSLATLMEDKEFDLSDLKGKFKSLLQKAYGKGYTIQVKKKSSAIDLDWDVLKTKMKEGDVNSEANAKTSSGLAELYSGKKNVKFNQKWNEKPSWLRKKGDKASATYYVK